MPINESDGLIKPARLTITIKRRQLWRHRKTGRFVTVLSVFNGLRVQLRHESGRTTTRQIYKLRYEYEPVEPMETIR